MQRFTRKNGRIPVESEVDREVERRELATTGSLLAPYCDCESRRGTNWSFFPCISHDISSYLLQCTTCRYLIPHAFKTSTSGAVRSVLNSQFTNHKSQFTTHNSRLYIGGHVFRNETASSLYLDDGVCTEGGDGQNGHLSKQAGDIGCRQPQAGHEIPYMYYHLPVGSSSTHMQVHVAVRIILLGASSPSPSFQHLPIPSS